MVESASSKRYRAFVDKLDSLIYIDTTTFRLASPRRDREITQSIVDPHWTIRTLPTISLFQLQLL